MGQCHSRRRSRWEPHAEGARTPWKAPRTVATLPSPTSIIIPEITEHVNHSFSSSSDDDEALMQMLSPPQQQPLPPSRSDSHQITAAATRNKARIDEDQHPINDMIVPGAGPASQLRHGNNKRYHHHAATSDPGSSSTSLITIQRERPTTRRPGAFHTGPLPTELPTSTDTRATTSPQIEDVVYSSDDAAANHDSSSPAVLRRLLAQTKSRLKSTGRIRHHHDPIPSTATSFSQVHESLTRSIIREEQQLDDEPSSFYHTTIGTKFPAVRMSDATAAPSDEESDGNFGGRPQRSAVMYVEPDPALPSLSHRRRKSRNRNSFKTQPAVTNRHATDSKLNHRLEKLGPLSPVKLKTSHCVSPQSIRVYHENDIPAIHSVSTSIKSNIDQSDPLTPTTLDTVPHATRDGPPLAPPNDAAAIDTRTIHNFSKLQLQIQVAARQAQKERFIHKVEDRMNDVQQHRQLWDVYQQIQDTVVNQDVSQVDTKTIQANTNSNIPASQDDMTPSENETTTNGVKLQTGDQSDIGPVRPPRRRKPRRFLRKGTVKEEAKSPSIPFPKPIVEYDLEEEIPIITKKKIASPRRAMLGGHKSKSSSNVTASIVNDVTTSETASHPVDTADASSTKKHPRVRSNSFDLHQTETWFFDFQDEFHTDPTQNKNKSTASQNLLPVDPYNNMNNVSSNNSHANLSLLSANSLEVQRRLYAEKRRQRKKASAAVVSTTPNGPPSIHLSDGHTPLARNGTNRGSSHRTVSSYDYGPSSKGRLPLFSDVRSSPFLGGGSAQDLYNAPNEAEKLRIAKEILKRRNVTNMEVTFATPKPARRTHVTNENGENSEIDNSSFVSDLDESYTSHHTNRSNQSVTNYDYGPQRRMSRRSRRLDGDAEDQSSIVSDVSFDLSHKLDTPLNMDNVGALNNNNNDENNPTKSSSTYDFQSVVQRRLDIEERLRALLSSDDAESTSPSSNIDNTKNVNQSLAAVAADTNGSRNYRLPPAAFANDDSRAENPTHVKRVVNTLDVGNVPSFSNDRHNFIETHCITPNSKDDPTALMAQTMNFDHVNHHPQNKSSFVTPNVNDETSHLRVYDVPSAKGRSDFSRLLDAVEVTRPGGMVDATTPDVTTMVSDTLAYSNDGKSMAMNELQDGNPPFSHSAATNGATSLSVINESYESSESPNSSNMMKLPVHYLRETTSDDRSITSRFDATNETLLLAHQVEAKVNDILERYRHNDDSSSFLTTAPQTSSSHVQEFSQTDMNEIHLIED